VWESEGGGAVLRFSSIRVREGGRRRCTVWRCDGRAAVASVDDNPVMGQLGPKWATLAGLRLGWHGKIKKMSWAAKAIGLNW
jgi:hypothetical protein